jgi:hypothetical protein
MEPTLIEKYSTGVTIAHSKQGHTTSFSGNFMDPDNVFHSKFAPGDWLFAWMFDNLEDAESVRARVKELKPCNEFWDGLKFVGRVTSVRRIVQVQQNGVISRRVSITGVAFGELDSQLYFDPLLEVENKTRTLFHKQLVGDVNGLMSAGVITPQSALPKLFRIFLGSGPGAKSTRKGAFMASPNRAFWLPESVGKLLNRKARDGILSYFDITENYYGVQKYDANGSDYKGFIPKIKSTNSLGQHFTSGDLVGAFGPQLSPWTGTPIWSALSQFSNAPVNEMYTTLRVAPDGKVVPHFIARQLPFSTEKYSKSVQDPCTTFKSLPRWKLPLEMIHQYDTGTTNSLRINYVHIRAQPLVSVKNEPAIFRSKVQPVFDPRDVNRNGLFGMITTINSTVSSATGIRSQFYTDFMADCMINGHLRFTGTVVSNGIQAPIAVGDNLEFDEAIYHIEGISHSLQINPGGGQKTFTTSLSLSHGIPKKENGEFLEIKQKPSDDSITNLPMMNEDMYV